MNVITMDRAALVSRRRDYRKSAQGRVGQLYDISGYAYERDKRKAGLEMRDYFVNRSREEAAWNLTGTLMSILRKQRFSSSEAKKITAFLARKFMIRLPDIEHAQCFTPSGVRFGREEQKKIPVRMMERRNELFRRVFLDLQAAVQEDVLDFRAARTLVVEMITSYPEAKESLHP